jgi:hypothetical protein
MALNSRLMCSNLEIVGVVMERKRELRVRMTVRARTEGSKAKSL